MQLPIKRTSFLLATTDRGKLLFRYLELFDCLKQLEIFVNDNESNDSKECFKNIVKLFELLINWTLFIHMIKHTKTPTNKQLLVEYNYYQLLTNRFNQLFCNECDPESSALASDVNLITIRTVVSSGTSFYAAECKYQILENLEHVKLDSVYDKLKKYANTFCFNLQMETKT